MLIKEAITKTGYKLGKDFLLSLMLQHLNFIKIKNIKSYQKKIVSRVINFQLFNQICKKYSIISLKIHLQKMIGKHGKNLH